MSASYNADEIYEMAEDIEASGIRFYTRAAETARDEGARKMLLSLAHMEEHHLQTFSTMRIRHREEKALPVTFDPDSEVENYLRALVERRVFDGSKNSDGRLTGKESIEEVLVKAIGLEKESIAFYVGVKAMVSAQEDAEEIDKIIREEMGHVARLNRELVSVSQAR